MRRWVGTAAACVALLLAGSAHVVAAPPVMTLPAAAPPAATPPAAAAPVAAYPTPRNDAAVALATADAAVDAGDLTQARALYDQVVRMFPSAPEAGEARRALKILAARDTGWQAPPPPAANLSGAAGDQTTGVVIRKEPYSLRTSERLRLTTWEKMDFGVTAFLYGMSVGLTYALANESNSSGGLNAGPVALGALAYTLGAVAYLKLANPDRGDLPLALAITSYLPTTVLLVANVAHDSPDGENTAYAVAGAGLVAAPLAVIAANQLDLDPGDTQLVRDAGFWGLVLGTTGMFGFGGSTQPTGIGFDSYQEPTGKSIAAASLIGLYGGMGLGTIAALNSEISLERVRVTTWGGYGGAVLGLLFSLTGDVEERDVFRGLSIGSAAGLIITFLATSGIDGIPPDDAGVVRTSLRRFVPTLMPMARGGGGGGHVPGFGFAGRF